MTRWLLLVVMLIVGGCETVVRSETVIGADAAVASQTVTARFTGDAADAARQNRGGLVAAVEAVTGVTGTVTDTGEVLTVTAPVDRFDPSVVAASEVTVTGGDGVVTVSVPAQPPGRLLDAIRAAAADTSSVGGVDIDALFDAAAGSTVVEVAVVMPGPVRSAMVRYDDGSAEPVTVTGPVVVWQQRAGRFRPGVLEVVSELGGTVEPVGAARWGRVAAAAIVAGSAVTAAGLWERSRQRV